MPKDPFLTQRLPESSRHQMNDPAFGSEITETFLIGNVPSLWLGKIVSFFKYRLFLIFCLLVFGLLFFRLGYLQIAQGSQFRQTAEGNRSRLEITPAARGVFYDYLGIPLVANEPTFTLFLNKGDLLANPDEENSFMAINEQKQLLDQKILATLLKSESYLPVPLVENIPYETALSLELELAGLKSFKISVDPLRSYQKDLGLSHLLGYLSRITPEEKDFYLKSGYQLTEKVGRAGLEQFYQDNLRGSPGAKQIEVDSTGSEKKLLSEKNPISGDSVFLNLDAGLQQQIIKTLSQKAPRQSGAVVALEPMTGKVRAFVSWPSYDNNLFSRGMTGDDYQKLLDNPLKPLFNRVISGEYPSGSTIKIIMSAAGLEEGVIDRFTSVFSQGGVRIDKWFFPDWKAGGHGVTNVIKALAESVNTFYYYLSLESLDGHFGLGLSRMIKYFKLFGLGDVLGIDLKGEKPGLVPDENWKQTVKGEIWYPGDTLHLAIGQGDLLVTPLQVAAFTSVIANGGTLYQPRLVDKILNQDKNVSNKVEPKILRENFLSADTVKTVADGLRAGVTSGSSRQLNSLVVPSYGKTGTAQTADGKNEHAWFTGYVAKGNDKLVLTVLIEHGGEGSAISVPIAYDIFDWYAKNRMLP